MKKKMVWVMAAVLTAGMLTGCGGGGTEKTDAQGTAVQPEEGTEDSAGYQTTYGDKQFDDVTITVELFDRSNAPEGSTLTDNRWVEYVNEHMNKVGINVEFVAVPRSDEVTKMQTMVASQSAPDLTLTYTYSYAEDYYNQGGIWNLSEFIDGEGQAENLKAYIGEDVLDIGRNVNGELYGIVAKRATTAQTNLFIRKDWLDALDLDIPSTTEELYQAIEQMVKKNPDGLTNVIGARLWGSDAGRNTLSLAFSQLGGDQKELDISNGFDFYYDPGYREFVRFYNRLYNNGLIDQEYYTETTDTFNSNLVNGEVGFFEAEVNYSVDILRGSLLKTLQENKPGADIVSIPPLENVNDGKRYVTTYAPGGLIAFCPKTADAETVEACMTYLDWMCTEEGGYVLYHGFAGEHYELDDNNVPIVLDADYNATDKDWIRTDLFLTGNQGYFATVDEFNACTAAENPGYEQYVIDNYNHSLEGTLVPQDTYTSPSTPELKADLSLLCNEWMVECITCPEEEFDAQYDAFLKEAESKGIQTIIEERTEHFNQVYGE